MHGSNSSGLNSADLQLIGFQSEGLQQCARIARPSVCAAQWTQACGGKVRNTERFPKRLYQPLFSSAGGWRTDLLGVRWREERPPPPADLQQASARVKKTSTFRALDHAAFSLEVFRCSHSQPSVRPLLVLFFKSRARQNSISKGINLVRLGVEPAILPPAIQTNCMSPAIDQKRCFHVG